MVLVQGKPEDVSDNVRRIIGETLGKGVIISSGCAIGANTPPENFSALISAARVYGSFERLCELREKQ